MPHTEHPGSVVLLAYHSINTCDEDRIRVPNIVTPDAFEAQIRYLSRNYHVIGLPECISRIQEGKPLPGKTAVITLDDGYKDNLAIASPILRKHGVPATFFIPTGCIGADKMKWEDELNCLIMRSNARALSLALPSGSVWVRIGSSKARQTAIDALVNILGHLDSTERSRMLDELRQQAKVQCDPSGVMLTWNEVRQLAETPGFSVGSHSVTHEHLQRIPLDKVVLEVTRSKEQLESELGRPVSLFAYPYGALDREVVTAVRRAGYGGAVTLQYGRNNVHSDPFRLRRVLVPNYAGARFRTGIGLRTSVFGEFLRRSYSMLGSLRRRAAMKKTSAKAGTVAPCGS